MSDARSDAYLLEVCSASASFAVDAAEAGADRVELCANLVEGGTTPSIGEIEIALDRLSVPMMVMVRPRGGDFLYDPSEYAIMERDIDRIREAGGEGVVFGILRRNGTIDVERTKGLVERARPMGVTFHRAFDVSRDLRAGIDELKACGVDRVLTSAGRRRVTDALDALALLAEAAGTDLSVLACGEVRADNVAAVLGTPGIREVHIGASARRPSAMDHRVFDVPMGRAYTPDEYVVEAADSGLIRAIAGTLRAVGPGT
ncbi:MAG: copper homeostasis protein CutC [Gemmatimonadota bacterium]